MKRTLLGMLVITALALGAVTAGAADAPAVGRGGGGPPWAHGGKGPRPFGLFAIFDADEDGALTEEEVPARVWMRLSAADLDDDGAVTHDEIMQYLRSRWGSSRPQGSGRPEGSSPPQGKPSN